MAASFFLNLTPAANRSMPRPTTTRRHRLSSTVSTAGLEMLTRCSAGFQGRRLQPVLFTTERRMCSQAHLSAAEGGGETQVEVLGIPFVWAPNKTSVLGGRGLPSTGWQRAWIRDQSLGIEQEYELFTGDGKSRRRLAATAPPLQSPGSAVPPPSTRSARETSMGLMGSDVECFCLCLQVASPPLLHFPRGQSSAGDRGATAYSDIVCYLH